MENGNRCMDSHLPNHYDTVSGIRRLLCTDRITTLANCRHHSYSRTVDGIYYTTIITKSRIALAIQLIHRCSTLTFKKVDTMKRLFFALLVMIPTEIFAQTFTNPPALFDPIPYGFSHVATVPADRKFVFVAGQGGEEDTTGKLSNDFRRQTQQALRNIETALRSQGLDMKAVVKVTTLVVEHDAEKLRIITEEFY